MVKLGNAVLSSVILALPAGVSVFDIICSFQGRTDRTCSTGHVNALAGASACASPSLSSRQMSALPMRLSDCNVHATTWLCELHFRRLSSLQDLQVYQLGALHVVLSTRHVQPQLLHLLPARALPPVLSHIRAASASLSFRHMLAQLKQHFGFHATAWPCHQYKSRSCFQGKSLLVWCLRCLPQMQELEQCILPFTRHVVETMLCQLPAVAGAPMLASARFSCQHLLTLPQRLASCDTHATAWPRWAIQTLEQHIYVGCLRRLPHIQESQQYVSLHMSLTRHVMIRIAATPVFASASLSCQHLLALRLALASFSDVSLYAAAFKCCLLLHATAWQDSLHSYSAPVVPTESHITQYLPTWDDARLTARVRFAWFIQLSHRRQPCIPAHTLMLPASQACTYAWLTARRSRSETMGTPRMYLLSMVLIHSLQCCVSLACP